jgi:prolyl-tRNA synthetase
MPVLKGTKSDNEKFAGAIDTYCIEALMQDKKALQAGTSHFLGQNFAKAFDVKFATKDGGLEHVWATSWGVSTRLMGALIMTHSDDFGLVLPPNLAPIQVVIVPIYRKDEELANICEVAEKIVLELKDKGVIVKFDDDDTKKPGWKFAEYEMKGVPIRLGLGPRDIENGTIEVARRDELSKATISRQEVSNHIPQLLNEIQDNLFQKAIQFRKKNSHEVDNYDDFKNIIDKEGGFVYAHWDGTSETELKIKEDTKATIRLIPISDDQESGSCIFSGRPSKQRVVFAKAY